MAHGCDSLESNLPSDILCLSQVDGGTSRVRLGLVPSPPGTESQ